MAELKGLFKEKRYTEVIAAVDAMAEPTVDDITLRAESRYMLDDYRQSLADFLIVFQANSTKTQFGIFQKARTAVGRAGMERKAIAEFWNSASDEPSRRMGRIATRLLAGEREGLTADFRAEVQALFESDALADAWVEAFDLLVAGLAGESQSDFHLAKTRNKIIVSGMGWSGSGAIYDYLKEFPQIHAIAGESSLIEGGGGFTAFVKASKSRNTCTSQVVQFFFRNLLGYYPMGNASCFKELRTTRLNAHSADIGLSYAQGARDVVRAMLQLVAVAGASIENIEQALMVLCDTIVERLIAAAAPDDKVLLLDNCIHIQNVRLARYLSKTLLSCCFRDPRTNFVARTREFAGFKESAEEYAKTTAAHRIKFENALDGEFIDCIARNETRVEKVRFEEFVVSEIYRSNLARSMGLLPDKRDAYRYFKPWESFKNTQLHLNYEQPQDIDFIKNQCSEYCVEFTTLSVVE